MQRCFIFSESAARYTLVLGRAIQGFSPTQFFLPLSRIVWPWKGNTHRILIDTVSILGNGGFCVRCSGGEGHCTLQPHTFMIPSVATATPPWQQSVTSDGSKAIAIAAGSCRYTIAWL